MLRTDTAAGAMYSPHELRVESRTALPRLAAWLAEAHQVSFFYGEAALEVSGNGVTTSARQLHAQRVVLCPGTDLTGVARPWLAHHALQLTRLQMLRLRPEPGFRLPAAVMGDLSLIRSAGYAKLAPTEALRTQLQAELPETLAAGIHLIAVQSDDGSLVVGDSHHDHASPDPFASDAVDQLILAQVTETLALRHCAVAERWTGVYPTGHSADCLIEAPEPGLRVVLVTSGTGASTAFGLAEDVFNQW
jgi:FAD dependent oxidoreductase TIGR03364